MHRRHFAVALLLAGLTTAPSWSEVVPPLGAQIAVNQTTQGKQSSPALAFSEGHYLAVWTGPDRDQHTEVFARLLDPAGVPLGDELLISSGFSVANLPRVAAGGGGFAVAWISQGVHLRLLDNAGRPRGDALLLDSSSFVVESCDVAVNAAGEVLVVWSTEGIGGRILARQVSPAGVPGETMEVARSNQLLQATPRVAAAPDGGFLTVWNDRTLFPPGTIQARRLSAGGAWEDPFQVSQRGSTSLAADVRPLFRPDGSFSILWRDHFSRFFPFPSINADFAKARSWDAAGHPITDEIQLDFNIAGPFDAALAPGGDTLALTASRAGVAGRLFDSAWHALTGDIVFKPTLFVPQAEPAVAVDTAGDFLALWTLGPESFPFFGDGSSTTVLGRPLGAIPCITSSDVLCLGPGGRFQARVAWSNPSNNQTGTGHAQPLTADTGTFWFFGDQNLELMVKVLDGTAVNQHFWVYAGSLSNVEYTLTVTDTATGAVRSYHNPPFQFASRADVDAFPAAAGADTAMQAAPIAALGSTAPLVGCLPVAAGPPTTLCLASGHFTVSVDFTDPRTGLAGQATAVPLTADTGAFWFFNDSNLELMVKVLDGRPVNGKFWVFYGALSDVDYTITVTRPETGEVRTYHNPKGTLASQADTQAF
ncbi:MAG TPA: hypothetical protein VIA62_09240 [Thermoanaerobaculia bacterium]|jgi:hypothetical protein|nr:hypothetical protein [Thermoanaerobaculia bacterium]